MKKKIVIIIAALIFLAIVTFSILTNGLSEGQDVVLSGINLSNISDGDYSGSYEDGRWSNTVTVHVVNSEITDIDIVKDVFANGLIDCSEEVFRRVIESQNTQIDVVSGATVTSKAYLKAIEAALNN